VENQAEYHRARSALFALREVGSVPACVVADTLFRLMDATDPVSFTAMCATTREAEQLLRWPPSAEVDA